LTGNIIPTSWYEHIRLPSGKPDVNAIILLAEIFYWFRPIEDGETTYQKFRSDELNLSYKQIEDKFGLTHKQARDALNRLSAAGLIDLKTRGFHTDNGEWHNRLFIDLNAREVLKITDLGEETHVDIDVKG